MHAELGTTGSSKNERRTLIRLTKTNFQIQITIIFDAFCLWFVVMIDIFCLFKGNHMHFHVTETKNLVGLYPGAAGVFTYYMAHKDLTLAVMFLYGRTIPGIHYHLYNVRVYPGRRKANKDLYEEMKSDKPYSNTGSSLKTLPDLGSGFSGLGGIVFIGKTPTVVIEIEMPPSFYKSTTE